MKILINTDQIYLHGGVEKVTATKANYWANLLNVEVFIVTTEQRGFPPRYPLDFRVKRIDLGVNYYRSKSYFSFENLKKSVIHFRKQKQVFKEIEPDIIISPNFNFDHYWLPFIKGKSNIIKERHSSRYYENELRESAKGFQKFRFLVNDWIDKKYNSIVVLNTDELPFVYTNNGIVIPNSVEEANVKANLSAKKVIAAGRISPVKNFEELIQAWELVHQEFPDWRLDIYGDDYLSMKAKLESQVQKEGLQDVVQIKESVANMREVMSGYSIYAMTSKTECFPMVLLEAMSVGLPIVSYDCPNGPRNIIHHGEDGLLVANGNVKEMADALKLVIGDTGKRQKMQIVALKNRKRFCTELVMEQWKPLLNLPYV